MRKILYFFVVITLTSCKTQNIYLFILPNERNIENVNTEFPQSHQRFKNRFMRKFQIADSTFNAIEKAAHEAAKSAFKETEHLIRYQ